MKNNSSLIGFKGTEDLGNGLKALFQIETNVNMTGNSSGGGVANDTSNSNFSSMRDTYVGISSKYGTGLGGYASTPYRSALVGFDVMPGATGDGRIESLMSKQRFGANGSTTTAAQLQSSVRTTALAYVMPTMYGFNGAIAYTGNNNNGDSGNVVQLENGTSSNTEAIQSGLSLNLGWSGYGVGIKGAFQQVKAAPSLNSNAGVLSGLQGYTSYLVGAQYTGVPGLKVAAVYNRNTSGWNQGNGGVGAMKGSNNQVWVGASYRFGNNEPRLSYANSSNTSGLEQANAGLNQDGAKIWAANWGYYLSKRTQVYGIISQITNNANGSFNMASGNSGLTLAGGEKVITYGAGLRTNF